MIKKTLQAVLFTFFNKITDDMITFDYIIHKVGWQSSRSGNESFLTYFRFRSSHTTVRAVRHTAV